MTSYVIQLAELSDREREDADALPALGRGDRLELHVRGAGGSDRTMNLPPAAMAAVEAVLTHLLRGERVAVLTDDQEISPNDAAAILGISRPLVVHRMEVGDLPFRYVGTHRRTRIKDVLALKARLDAQQAALDALAEDTEALRRDHAL